MRALVACPRRLLLVDIQRRSIGVVEGHRHEYYGVSWPFSGNELCLGHSGVVNDCVNTLDDYVKAEKGVVSLGRRQTDHAVLAPHQIVCTEEHVIATNTGRNCLTIFRQADLYFRHRWLDDAQWDRLGRDVFCGSHYNSVFVDGRHLYVVGHNFARPSFVLVLSWPDLAVEQRIKTTASGAHNVWRMPDGHLLICDTMRGSLVDITEGRTVWQCGRAGSLTRGLATDGRTLLVGHSQLMSRNGRANSDGGIYVIDLATWKTLDFLELPGMGMVNEIRLVDVPDLCHHGRPLAVVPQCDPVA